LYLGPIFTVRGHRYRFLDTIGQGSAATVYRCEDPTATQYAVKVFYFSRFSPSLLPRKVQSFHKEARILKYMGSRSRHFLYLVEHEYNPRENVGYMILELGDGSLRRNLLGIPLDEESLGMYWKQIVTILKDLQDANVGK
jgi:serine/threonine protein kinase